MRRIGGADANGELNSIGLAEAGTSSTPSGARVSRPAVASNRRTQWVRRPALCSGELTLICGAPRTGQSNPMGLKFLLPVMAAAPFPLTPAPSPGERENGRQSVGVSSTAGIFARRGELFRLPERRGFENVHATAARSCAKWPVRSSSARRASWTASAIASVVILPSPQP